LGHYYAWASPNYLLDRCSIEQIFLYYEYMVAALTGKPVNRDRPDLNKLHACYPDLAKGQVVKA